MTRDEDSNSQLAFRILNKAKSKQTDQACVIIIYHHLIGQMTLRRRQESRFQRHAALRNLSFSPAVSKPLII